MKKHIYGHNENTYMSVQKKVKPPQDVLTSLCNKVECRHELDLEHPCRQDEGSKVPLWMILAGLRNSAKLMVDMLSSFCLRYTETRTPWVFDDACVDTTTAAWAMWHPWTLSSQARHLWFSGHNGARGVIVYTTTEFETRNLILSLISDFAGARSKENPAERI